MDDKCKELKAHLSRIQGQINTLKDYIESDRDCKDIVNLSLSVGKSFDAYKAKLTEAYVSRELLEKGKISSNDFEGLLDFIRMIKK
jgi:DNA-binding FrmR family transcriptional regulator